MTSGGKKLFSFARLAGVVAVVLLALPALGTTVHRAERLTIEHPFRSPQKFTDHERCDNCGMDRNKYARTRYEFETDRGTHYTCSIACVAVLGMKLNEQSRNVRVAEYLHPEKMLDAGRAFYVMGSTAPGTMTAVSKIAFESRKKAAAFAARYGGKVVGFSDALDAARKEATGER